MADNFFQDQKGEDEGFRMGSELLPVDLSLTMVEIANLNSGSPLLRTIILSDGQELDLNIFLETDRQVLSKAIKEAVNEATKDSD